MAHRIEFVALDELVPYAKNARRHSDDQIEQIANSIKEFGFNNPILVDEKKGIIAGHGRFEAAVRLGFVHVPIVKLSHLTEAQKQAYIIADNKIAENAEWDFELLADELIEISEADIDVSSLGFSDDEILDLLPDLGSEGDGKKKDSKSKNLGEVELTEDEFDALELEEKGLIKQAPIISYYGGKQRIASKIIPLIPKHTVYVEPFCGGAAVFFAKPWPDVSSAGTYREVLNDKDECLVNFYKQFRDNGEEIQRRLLLTPYSRVEHNLSIEKLTEGSDLDRAVNYYYNIMSSFSHKLSSGWAYAVFSKNNAFTFAKKVARLDEYFKRMTGVHIECKDALEIIDTWDSPQTFFYIDPPYPETNLGHYGGYSHDDLKALCEKLDKIQGSFILSNYYQDYIPKHWEYFTIEAICSATGRVGQKDKSKKFEFKEGSVKNKRIEHLWRKKSSVEPRDEIKKLYESGAFDCFTG